MVERDTAAQRPSGDAVTPTTPVHCIFNTYSIPMRAATRIVKDADKRSAEPNEKTKLDNIDIH